MAGWTSEVQYCQIRLWERDTSAAHGSIANVADNQKSSIQADVTHLPRSLGVRPAGIRQEDSHSLQLMLLLLC
jgi:hypothetical protein